MKEIEQSEWYKKCYEHVYQVIKFAPDRNIPVAEGVASSLRMSIKCDGKPLGMLQEVRTHLSEAPYYTITVVRAAVNIGLKPENQEKVKKGILIAKSRAILEEELHGYLADYSSASFPGTFEDATWPLVEIIGDRDEVLMVKSTWPIVPVAFSEEWPQKIKYENFEGIVVLQTRGPKLFNSFT